MGIPPAADLGRASKLGIGDWQNIPAIFISCLWNNKVAINI
jgi:hypothetical protein